MRVIILVFLLLLSPLGRAQEQPEILLTVGDLKVSTLEFGRVYKKNLELVQEESQRTVDGYMDLFIDYKLKVAEAKAQGLDQEPVYRQEFAKYQDQLSRTYIYQDRVLEDLIEEAYQRGRFELDVDHILIRVGRNALPQDTLVAYEKISSIRSRILAGEDFTTLAKAESEEPGASERGGSLGYISVFSTVYPFESMAYSTVVGEVSGIVRTDFGYHILRVNDKRERSPQLTVSHIMIADRQDAGTLDPEQRIGEIYTLLQQGQTFESLAKEYSEDKGSAKNGGKLRPFARGELRSIAFTDQAYSMKEVGEVSEPFQSEFGWHIMRLEKVHPIPSLDEQRETISKRVQNGNRSKVITQNIVGLIKEKYGYSRLNSYFDSAMEWIGDVVLNRRWVMDTLETERDTPLFKIGDRTVRLNDFGAFVQERQRRIRMPQTKGELLTVLYNEFEPDRIQQYFKDRLEVDNPEYAAVIAEYRDGLLIFDVMDKNVWSKARTDSIGLQAFFNDHRSDYSWKERLILNRYSLSGGASVDELLAEIDAGRSVDMIKETFNRNDSIQLIVTPMVMEQGDDSIPQSLSWEPGATAVVTTDGSIQLWQVEEVRKAGPKLLDEARGQVVGDYQEYLETQWLKQLRGRYPVEINKKALKRLKKELEQ